MDNSAADSMSGNISRQLYTNPGEFPASELDYEEDDFLSETSDSYSSEANESLEPPINGFTYVYLGAPNQDAHEPALWEKVNLKRDKGDNLNAIRERLRKGEDVFAGYLGEVGRKKYGYLVVEIQKEAAAEALTKLEETPAHTTASHTDDGNSIPTVFYAPSAIQTDDENHSTVNSTSALPDTPKEETPLNKHTSWSTTIISILFLALLVELLLCFHAITECSTYLT